MTCSLFLQALATLDISDLLDILDGSASLVFQGTGGINLDCLSINGSGQIVLDTTFGAGDYLLEIGLNLDLGASLSLGLITGLTFDVDVTNINGTVSILSGIRFPNLSVTTLLATLIGPISISSGTMFTIDPADILGTTTLNISLSGAFTTLLGPVLNLGLPYTVKITKIS
jgi:hypothetical protein